MSSIRIIAGVIFFCLGTASAIISTMFRTMMIGEVNRKKSEDELISYVGSTPLKTQRIFSEYRRLHPNGRLHLYARASLIVMMIALLITAVCFHIIG
ncbi:MAG: hypothetical protein QOH70_649 [Blastocatellia bacterium]|jgi:hypothetical protein|nr:hypothetical protein [Blastocatellia bacterium]